MERMQACLPKLWANQSKKIGHSLAGSNTINYIAERKTQKNIASDITDYAVTGA
jgi:hypothetical protein